VRFLSSESIFNGTEFLNKNSILVINEKNQFIDIIEESQLDPLQIERFDGIITPGFVNTHCHLELSYFQNIIPQKTGLVNFAKNIISKRSQFSVEQMNKAIEQADSFMENNGIAVVGDISNTNLSFKTKQKSKLYYHSFIELIGLNSEKKENILEGGIALLKELQNLGLIGSLAPHAPYSTSVQLIEAISNYNSKNNLPFSIHNQESEEENKFLQGEKSEFYNLFEFLNIDISWFKPKHRSSLNAYSSFLKSKKNILVHNTFTSQEDYGSVGSHVFWCLCPTANLYIENKLPDYDILLSNSKQICFGTDSLASNSNLDILKEGSIFYSKTKDLGLSLRALTYNGAAALDLQENFGSFIKAKNTGLNLIEVKQDKFLLKEVIVVADRLSLLV